MATNRHAPIKVLFFDVHDTLIDRKRTFERAFRTVFLEWGGRWIQGKEAAAHALLRYRAKAKTLPVSSKRPVEAVKAALAPYPFPDTEPFANQFLDSVRKLEIEKPIVFKGVRSSLQQLSQRYRLGVISNARAEAIQQKLSNARLLSFMDRSLIITSDLAGATKPNLQIYRYALQAAQVEPKEAAMISHSLRNDLRGAREAGMSAVWLTSTRGKKAAQPRKIQSIAELL